MNLFPQMLYKSEDEYIIVSSPDELKEAQNKGYIEYHAIIQRLQQEDNLEKYKKRDEVGQAAKASGSNRIKRCKESKVKKG